MKIVCMCTVNIMTLNMNFSFKRAVHKEEVKVVEPFLLPLTIFFSKRKK